MTIKTFEIKVNFGGQNISVNILFKNICGGTINPIKVNGNYVFTFLRNEDVDRSVLLINSAISASVENEIYNMTLKKRHYEFLCAS